MNGTQIFNHPIRDDDDNVHDRNVNELSKYYFNTIRESNTDLFTEKFMDDVERHLNESNLTEFKKSVVRDYLTFVRRRKEFIVNFNCDELEFLFFMWSRIKSPRNSEHTDLLVDNFFSMILDCYEEDIDFFLGYRIKRLVCTSGRIMKILSTFAHIDSDIGLFLSNDILKKEFLSKISIYYGECTNKEYFEEIIDDIIKEYNPAYKEQLENFKKELLDSLTFA